MDELDVSDEVIESAMEVVVGQVEGVVAEENTVDPFVEIVDVVDPSAEIVDALDDEIVEEELEEIIIA